jgi:hypothetical protein
MYTVAQAKKDSVQTPHHVTKWIKTKFGKFYDPVPLRRDFNPSKHKDALTTEWGKLSYANVPFSQTQKFVKKGVEEWKKGKTIILMVKTNTLGMSYFRESRGCEIVFFPKALIFPGHKVAPRFHVCLLIYRANKRSSKYSFFTG